MIYIIYISVDDNCVERSREAASARSARRGRKGRFSTFAPVRAPHSAISAPKTELLRPCGREVMGGLPPRCAPFGRLRGVMHGCALRALAASAATAPIPLLPSTYSAQYLTIMCMTGGISLPANLIEFHYIPLEGCFSKAAKAASARSARQS